MKRHITINRRSHLQYDPSVRSEWFRSSTQQNKEERSQLTIDFFNFNERKMTTNDFLTAIKQHLHFTSQLMKQPDSPVKSGSRTNRSSVQKSMFRSTSSHKSYEKTTIHALKQNDSFKGIQGKIPMMLKSTQALIEAGSVTKDYFELKDVLADAVEKANDLKIQEESYNQNERLLIERISQNFYSIQKLADGLIASLTPQQSVQIIKCATQNIDNQLQQYNIQDPTSQQGTDIKSDDLKNILLNNKLIRQQAQWLQKCMKENKQKEEQQELAKHSSNEDKMSETWNKNPVYYTEEDVEIKIQNALQEYKLKEELTQHQHIKCQEIIQELRNEINQKNNQIQELRQSVFQLKIQSSSPIKDNTQQIKLLTKTDSSWFSPDSDNTSQKLTTDIIDPSNPQKSLQIIDSATRKIDNLLQSYQERIENKKNIQFASLKVSEYKLLYTNHQIIKGETNILRKIIENQSNQLENSTKEISRLNEELNIYKEKGCLHNESGNQQDRKGVMEIQKEIEEFQLFANQLKNSIKRGEEKLHSIKTTASYFDIVIKEKKQQIEKFNQEEKKLNFSYFRHQAQASNHQLNPIHNLKHKSLSQFEHHKVEFIE